VGKDGRQRIDRSGRVAPPAHAGRPVNAAARPGLLSPQPPSELSGDDLFLWQ
jgi:hypothetical protein